MKTATPPDPSRRRLITFVATLPFAAFLGLRAQLHAATANLPRVGPDDPTAKALGYVEDASSVDPKANPTFKPGNCCANCLHYKASATEAWGPCALFPGKAVAAKGWCRVWAKSA